MESVWEKTTERISFGRLEKDIKTDVLVIGGGMAGLLCAYMLDRAGIDYILAEAETVCSGITKNTTAKITSQHGLIYDSLIRRFGIEKAKQYLYANELALQTFADICMDIDCDFEYKDSYVYSLDNRKKLENELTALDKLGFHADFEERLPLPFEVSGAVKFSNQAQFNPLKFAFGISKGLNIFEHTKVRELVGTTAVTEHGKIFANKIIVATHFPFVNKHGGYFLKMYQHRSYVIALENAQIASEAYNINSVYDVNGIYVDEKPKGMSFRNYENLLLIGGGDHRTGKNGGCWQELRDFAKRYYPGTIEKYHFATQDCMTLDSVPYIGSYSSGTKDLYVASGFNKWGMTSSMVSAIILCDAVRGRKNAYADVFSPSRTILRPLLALNAFEAVVNLLTPTAKRCPHLGCALKWNKAEHTFDCPCHGSRFTENGRLIDNPATGDLKK